MSEESKPAATPQDKEVEHTCEKCGRYDAIEVGDQFLCADCITLSGCACAEAEMDE
ncbi:MAG TPA: hypothetical protein VFV81_01230 [Verrucomicrobiae bacterium]|nr:hypothetical protein [Verrucomicrobiae bacterium]